jgi:putative hydrolase of HD superfamily
MDRLKQQLAFLTEIDRMKTVYRRNVVIDRSRQEDDAAHSWHMAMFALVLAEYAPEALDMLTVLKLCLVHDLVEVYAGDTFCYDAAGNLDKAERERQAADRLFALLPAEQGNEYRTLWEEFDAPSTPEGWFAAAIDRLQPFILNFHTDGHTWHLAPVKRVDLLRRLNPVRTGIPALWPDVLKMVDEAIENGYLPAEKEGMTK